MRLIILIGLAGAVWYVALKLPPASPAAPKNAVAAAKAPAASPPVEKPRYDQLVITASSFRVNNAGMAETHLRLKNISDRDIKDAVLVYSFAARSGTELGKRRATLYQRFPAHSDDAYSFSVLVPEQTDSATFQVESYTLLP